MEVFVSILDRTPTHSYVVGVFDTKNAALAVTREVLLNITKSTIEIQQKKNVWWSYAVL